MNGRRAGRVQGNAGGVTSLTAARDRRSDAARTAVLRARAAGLGLVALLALVLVLVLVESEWAPLVRLDDGVRDGLNAVAVRSPALVWGMKAVSSLGTIGVYLLLLVGLAVHLLRRGRARVAAFAAWTVVMGSVLNTTVKALVDRARPLLDDPVASAAHSSFPSGHAQGVVVAGGVLLVALWPVLPVARRGPAVVAVAAWALLMGASRVLLGVHYVSDVVGGYLLALAWLALCTAAFAPWVTRSAQLEPRR